MLEDAGLVYAETPSKRQMHGGRYDFTRFTRLGQRRLFGRSEGIESGAVGGPGLAPARVYRYFPLSFARFTASHCKYRDRYLIDRPARSMRSRDALSRAAGVSAPSPTRNCSPSSEGRYSERRGGAALADAVRGDQLRRHTWTRR